MAKVSDDEPCGEDLSDLTEYYVLEEQAKGKEETQFSKAEPPDWQQVETLSRDLLLKGKEMWVIYHLICAMTANHGIAGLREGIEFLSRMLSTFWEHIFPEPDFDDPNPYEQRMGILSSFSDFSSPLMENIRNMPICKSRQIGEFSYRDILVARGDIKPPKGEAPPDITLIEAAVRDTDPEFTQNLVSELQETREQVKAIDAFLDETGGSQNNISGLHKFADAITAVLSCVEPFALPSAAEPEAASEGEGTEPDALADAAGQDTGTAAAPAPQGELRSRDDVYALLSEMIQWYEQNEPASPVAMLLDRAKSLVGKNFIQILTSVLGPELPQIQALFGPLDGYPVLESTPAIRQSGFNIRSRNDILTWLDKLTAWYGGSEPSSPVPYFIHRARQLVGKNFDQIISEIANQAQNQVADLLKNK